ncbi:MAG: hypothetical protein AAFU03_11415 [Bacteroidota bacterium]
MNKLALMRLPFRLLLLLILLFGWACSAPPSEESVPTTSVMDDLPDHYITLTAGPLSLSVDPFIGGRIASFRHNGVEILQTVRDSNNFYWGSTVWTSPQTDWGWPPQAVFDSEPYSVNRSPKDTTRMVLISGIDQKTGLQVIKNIRLAIDEAMGPVATLRYRIYNRGEEMQRVGVWENTRIPWSGTVELPGEGNIHLKDPQNGLYKEQPDSATLRIPLNNQQVQAQKIFYNFPLLGPGKLISPRYENDGLVFTKKWKYPGRVAPEQSPIEIYLAPEENFAELELHSQYVTLPKGGNIEFTVFWQAYEL